MSQHGVHNHEHYYCETCKVPHLFEVGAAGHVDFCMSTCETYGKKKAQQTGTHAAPWVRACMSRCGDLVWAPPKPSTSGRHTRKRKRGVLKQLFGRNKRRRRRSSRFGVGKITAGWQASARMEAGSWIVRVVTTTGTSPPLLKAAFVETLSPMQIAKAAKTPMRLPRPPGSKAPVRYDVEAPKGFGRPTSVVLEFMDGAKVKTKVAPPTGRRPGPGSVRTRRKRKRGFFARLFGTRARRRFAVAGCDTWVSDHGAHGREVMSVGHGSPQHWHEGQRQVTKAGYAPTPDMSIGCSARCGGRF